MGTSRLTRSSLFLPIGPMDMFHTGCVGSSAPNETDPGEIIRDEIYKTRLERCLLMKTSTYTLKIYLLQI